MERFFLRGTLDHLGIDFQVAKRHEYKSAAEQLTERNCSGPAREATERLASSVTGQLTDAIAERRRIGASEVRELIDRGPFLAAQAHEAGLVDELGYRDEVYTRGRKQAGGDADPPHIGPYQWSRSLGSGLAGCRAPVSVMWR